MVVWIAGPYTIRRERYGERAGWIYICPMPNNTLAPIESERTTTSLNVDREEWVIFVMLMKDQGRSASDRVRQMVREVVREHRAANGGRRRRAA